MAGTAVPTDYSSRSPVPMTTPTPTFTPGDPKKIGLVLLVKKVNASTPDEWAAVAAAMGVDDAALPMLNRGDGDVAALDRFAIDPVKSRMAALVAAERKKGLRVGGHIVYIVKKVTVAGDRAVLDICIDDHSTEYNRAGEDQLSALGQYARRDTVVRVGGSWKVSDSTSKGIPPCEHWEWA